MADKKNKKKVQLDDEIEGRGDPVDPARDARVKSIRDRLSVGDDGGPISLETGGRFYEENRKMSPEEVKRDWDEEARFPGPPKPGETFRQGRPEPMRVDPRDTAQPAPDHGGDLIGAILHGLGLGKARR